MADDLTDNVGNTVTRASATPVQAGPNLVSSAAANEQLGVRAILATEPSIAIGDVGIIGDDNGTLLGSKGDTSWDGAAATPTLMAIFKYLGLKIEAVRALLAGTVAVSVGTPVKVAGDDAAALVGTKADAGWDGAAASPTWTSVLKYIGLKIEAVRALLAGTIAVSLGTPVKIAGDDAATLVGTKADAGWDGAAAAPTWTSVLKYVGLKIEAVRALLAGTIAVALSASETHLGEVGGNSAVVPATVTRPANTTTYSSGQLVANNTVAGSVTPMVLAVARATNKTGMIRRGRLTKNNAAVLNAIFRVHLYRDSPTPTNGDGGTFLTNQALTYIGSMDFDMTGANARAFSDGVTCISTPNVGSDIIFVSSPGTANIFALIEARAAYTPASGEIFTFALEVMRD